MILLYANELEVQFIDYKPKFYIGLGAYLITDFFKYSYPHLLPQGIILFGSCGLLSGDFKLNEFVIPQIWNLERVYYRTVLA